MSGRAAGQMRAAVLRGHGDLDALSLATVPVPRPAEGEVRLAVQACALNWFDVLLRRIPNFAGAALPVVCGVDVAGVIDAVGRGVDPARIGEHVVVYPFLPCGACELCRAGDESVCPKRRFLGAHRDGGLAQYVTVPESSVVPKPDSLGAVEAAALPVSATTAWHMVIEVGGLERGETVVVLGATGGVGSIAVQIAAAHGARVLAVTSGEDRVGALRRLGADDVVDRSREAWAAELADRAGGADLVINPVGGDVLDAGLRALRTNGRMVVGGARSGAQGAVDIRLLYHRQLRVLGANGGTLSGLRSALDLADRGALRPVVGNVLALDQVHRGYRLVENGGLLGKVVVTIA